MGSQAITLRSPVPRDDHDVEANCTSSNNAGCEFNKFMGYVAGGMIGGMIGMGISAFFSLKIMEYSTADEKQDDAYDYKVIVMCLGTGAVLGGASGVAIADCISNRFGKYLKI
ncbi:MAG: hypothetical protein HAW66_10785 [Shewanella sp.]|nr:hypothetical protein [Shewanella sp.]